MARVDAATIRQALRTADLEWNMTRRIAQACHCSKTTVFKNLAAQGTTVRALVREERLRRLHEWHRNLPQNESLADLTKMLGYADRTSTRAFLQRETGRSYKDWTQRRKL